MISFLSVSSTDFFMHLLILILLLCRNILFSFIFFEKEKKFGRRKIGEKKDHFPPDA